MKAGTLMYKTNETAGALTTNISTAQYEFYNLSRAIETVSGNQVNVTLKQNVYCYCFNEIPSASQKSVSATLQTTGLAQNRLYTFQLWLSGFTEQLQDFSISGFTKIGDTQSFPVSGTHVFTVRYGNISGTEIRQYNYSYSF